MTINFVNSGLLSVLWDSVVTWYLVTTVSHCIAGGICASGWAGEVGF